MKQQKYIRFTTLNDLEIAIKKISIFNERCYQEIKIFLMVNCIRNETKVDGSIAFDPIEVVNPEAYPKFLEAHKLSRAELDKTLGVHSLSETTEANVELIGDLSFRLN